ncbi:MAG: hypothetical protein ABUL58_06195 [Steroidobacter sp.]
MCPVTMRYQSWIPASQIVLLMCLYTSSASALEWLSVQVPAPYESELTIPDHIRKDCIGLERTVGVEVAYQLEKSGFAKIDRVERVNLKASGKLLSLNITQADASVGAWTDPKSLTVKAELFQDGKSIEWTTISHTSRQQQDVCEVLEKNATAIAVDVHKWLVSTLASKTLPVNLNGDSSSGAAGMRQLQARNLWISSKLQYDLDIPGQQLITQCNVEESLTEQARTVFSRSLSVRRLNKAENQTADDDVLQFAVVDIKGNMDNSPEKRSMTLKAELLRNGIVIDTFNGMHSTERGGLFGQVVRNTCDALKNISDTMANDTYQWYINRGRNIVQAGAAASKDSTQAHSP